MLTSEDHREIHALKARYFRAIDTKRWERMPELFTEDARFEGLWAAADGPRGFVANLERNLGPGTVSVHQGFMPEIVGIAPGLARGVWAMSDYLLWPVDSRAYLGVSLPGQRGIRGYGHYEEEYRFDRGRWRIAVLRLSRLHLEPVLGDEPSGPEHPAARLLDDWLGGGGA